MECDDACIENQGMLENTQKSWAVRKDTTHLISAVEQNNDFLQQELPSTGKQVNKIVNCAV